MADWATISSLATAGGTLVLAAATFASVKSANRSARIAERSLQLGLRPILVPARPEDPPENVPFPDRMFELPAGRALVEEDDGILFLGLSLRNVGAGLAILEGGYVRAARVGAGIPHADPEQFRLLQRDLFVPAGATGYWHASLRDPDVDMYRELRPAIDERQAISIELLYGDFEGGQRTITRFGVLPRGDGWSAAVMKHWSVDAE